MTYHAPNATKTNKECWRSEKVFVCLFSCLLAFGMCVLFCFGVNFFLLFSFVGDAVRVKVKNGQTGK